jgi:hypothetical protein
LETLQVLTGTKPQIGEEELMVVDKKATSTWWKLRKASLSAALQQPQRVQLHCQL